MDNIGIRKASITDVRFIHQLVNDFAKLERMLPRPLGELYETVRDFLVAEHDGRQIGCAGLHVVWEDLAEIKSLAICEEYQGKGAGRLLVNACLDEARSLGIAKVFVLTCVPKFFRAHGFVDIPKEELPHKVWADCVRCPKFPDCDEEALALELA